VSKREALFLAEHAERVVLIIRRDSLAEGMSRYLVDRIEADDRIRVLTGARVLELHGENRLDGITVRRGERTRLDVRALFVFTGAVPHTDWLGDSVLLDAAGFVLTGADIVSRQRTAARPLETSVPGVFAAGDVRSGSTKRVAAAVGEGAMVVPFVHAHLADHPPTRTGAAG
jgi:thioredoxin reductase (NADPH)